MMSSSGRTILTDQRIDADLAGDRLQNHVFVRLTAKSKKFTEVDFKYSIFDTSYLRDCMFDSCDFTGCRFTATNLHGARFQGCKFDYAIFDALTVVVVDIDVLLSNET